MVPGEKVPETTVAHPGLRGRIGGALDGTGLGAGVLTEGKARTRGSRLHPGVKTPQTHISQFILLTLPCLLRLNPIGLGFKSLHLKRLKELSQQT